MTDVRLFTLAEMAEIIAKGEGASEERASYLHRRFRDLHRQRALPIAGFDGQGRTATALFDESAVFLAALIVHVSDAPLRFDSTVQVDFAAVVAKASDGHWPDQRPHSQRVDGGWSVSIGPASAVRGVKEGEKWSLHLHIWRDDSKADRSVHFGATFLTDGAQPVWRDDSKADRTLKSMGRQTVARVEIPLNSIFEPLIAAIEAN